MGHADGPRIGVAFESGDEIAESIKEMAKNCLWNESYCALRKTCAPLERNDSRRQLLEEQMNAYQAQLEAYDLMEVSKSFFAYQPILKALQGMDSLPMSPELVGTERAAIRPDYLPQRIALPKKAFGRYEIDMNNWDLDDIAKETSLDSSQAKALQHSLTTRVVLTQGPPGMYLG